MDRFSNNHTWNAVSKNKGTATNQTGFTTATGAASASAEPAAREERVEERDANQNLVSRNLTVAAEGKSSELCN